MSTKIITQERIEEIISEVEKRAETPFITPPDDTGVYKFENHMPPRISEYLEQVATNGLSDVDLAEMARKANLIAEVL